MEVHAAPEGRRAKRISPEKEAINWLLKEEDPPHFEVSFIDDRKGYGVFSKKRFQQGEFLLQYPGEILNTKEAEYRENIYSKRNRRRKYPRCYTFYLKHEGKSWCIDATNVAGRVGNLVNDNTIRLSNSKMRKMIIKNTIHLALFATKTIEVNQEITYDYGDVPDLWWRKPKAVIRNGKAQIRNKTSRASFQHNASNSLRSCNKKGDSDSPVDERYGQKIDSANFSSGRDNFGSPVSECNPASPVIERCGPSCSQSKRSGSASPNIDSDNTGGSNSVAPVSKKYGPSCSQKQRTRSASPDFSGLHSERITNETSRPSPQHNSSYSLSPNHKRSDLGNPVCALYEPSCDSASFHSGENDLGNPVSEKWGPSCSHSQKSRSASPQCVRSNSGSPMSERCGPCYSQSQRNGAASINFASPPSESSDSGSRMSERVGPADTLSRRSRSAKTHSDRDGPAKRYFKTDNTRASHHHELTDKDSSDMTDDLDESISDNYSDVEDSSYSPETYTSSDTSMIPDSEVSDTVHALYPALNPDQRDKHVLCNESKTTVRVKACSRTSEGKKVWDKKYFCIYCEKAISKLPRHLETKHKNELEIVKLRSLDRRNKEQRDERMRIIQRLRNKGNYNHNINVMETGSGEIVTKKSLTKVKQKEDYLPCQYCLGFYLRTDLYRHVKSCFMAPKLTKGTRHQSHSALLLPSSSEENIIEDIRKNVIAGMVFDNIALCIRNDQLIMLFGQRLYKKNRDLTHLNQFIRTKMRELARFLLKVRDLDNTIISLRDCISPQKFQTVVNSVRSLCGFDFNNKSDMIPSLALKIGHSLSKCANILIAQAIAQDDMELQTRAQNFLKLYSMEWNIEVSSAALKIIDTRKWNRPSFLPLTADLITFHKYIDELIECSITKIRNKDSTAWRMLCETTLTSVLLFNIRRSGEVERITLKEYQEKSNCNIPQEVLESLRSVEKHLALKLTRIEVRGKRGRKVPILFTKNIQVALDCLISSRGEAGIDDENPFVFANMALGYIRGTDCLRKLSSVAGLKQPENIRTTQLRKHIATLSQIINLKKNELDILAQFLGHDINVHRSFYRLPESTLQLAKIGKLLMAVNKGKLAEFAGKSLDEIHVDGQVSEESSDEEVAEEIVDASDNLKTRQEKRRKKWLLEERTVVLNFFKRDIKLGRIPGKKQIHQLMHDHNILKKRSWNNIKDFVRNHIVKQRKKSVQ